TTTVRPSSSAAFSNVPSTSVISLHRTGARDSGRAWVVALRSAAASAEKMARRCIEITMATSSGHASELLVDGRIGIQKQRHYVFDLGLGQDAGIAVARHLRTQVVGVRVPDLAPCVLDNRLGVAAHLAVAL